jgi:hypothetical protein
LPPSRRDDHRHPAEFRDALPMRRLMGLDVGTKTIGIACAMPLDDRQPASSSTAQVHGSEQLKRSRRAQAVKGS